MVKARLVCVGIRESTCPGARKRVPSGRMEDVKRIGGKEATAAMADLLGHRHLLIPAGVPWFA